MSLDIANPSQLTGRTLSIEVVADVPEIAIHVGKADNPYAPLAFERALVERHDGVFVKVKGYEFSTNVAQHGGIERFAHAAITGLQRWTATEDYRLVEPQPETKPETKPAPAWIENDTCRNCDRPITRNADAPIWRHPTYRTSAWCDASMTALATPYLAKRRKAGV